MKAAATPPLELLTVMAGPETFGLPVAQVQTIFHVGAITPVPLGPAAVLGLVNLRGRIIPAFSLRRRLGYPEDRPHVGSLAVGLDLGTEAFALLVDDVGDVLSLPSDQELALPPHVSDDRLGLTRAVYRRPGSVIAVLDVSALASFPEQVTSVLTLPQPETNWLATAS